MHEAATLLAAWANFYVILGSAAGALTGLVFVVITLIAETGAQSASQATEASIATFTTPTVVHFCVVLLVCATLSVPWQALWPAGLLLGLAGLGGLAYAIVSVRRVRRQPGYRPVLEDWVWYGGVPLVAYTTLSVSALLLPGNPALALFGIGAIAMLLLFLGIHNAWDVVTYIALLRVQTQNAPKD